MAHFCAKCGAPVNEGAAFCAKCGARVEAPASSPAPSAVPPSPPPAAAPSPAAPSPAPGKKSGSLFLKVVVAILAFIALVSVLVIGSCFYIGYRIKKKADEVQQAYKKGDMGKILGALGQGPAQGGSGTEETVQEQPCPAVDPSQSKTFRDAAASASIPLKPG